MARGIGARVMARVHARVHGEGSERGARGQSEGEGEDLVPTFSSWFWWLLRGSGMT